RQRQLGRIETAVAVACALERDPLALGKRAKPERIDIADMDEEIGSGLVRFDEAEALLLLEPQNRAGLPACFRFLCHSAICRCHRHPGYRASGNTPRRSAGK